MDIVKRLRDYADGLSGYAADMMVEAADEIERLRADVDRMASLAIDNARDMLRLREVLKRIGDGDQCTVLLTYPTICQRAYEARAALKEAE